MLVLQLIVVGLATGAIYALIALGYTMVYGIIELINFAHGDIFMIGTFVSLAILSFLSPFNLPLVAILLIAFLGAVLACAVLGVVIERIAYRPLRNAPRLAPLISAIGVSLILQDVGKLWGGVNLVNFPRIFPLINIPLGPVTVNTVDMLVLGVALVLMAALQWMVTSTSVGRAMRAVAQDREAAALMGVNVDRIIMITFFIGAGLAGAAALIFGLKYGSTVFYLGFRIGLIAFTAAVLGGIGNIVGAMLGGLLIGLIESLANIIPNSNDPTSHGLGIPNGGAAWIPAIIFGILILILVFRPSGLLGQHTPDKV